MSVPITTQPQPGSNTENPNFDSTDTFSNESKGENEVLQPFTANIENEAMDAEEKKKRNDGWCACCNDTDDVDTVFDLCECLAWFSSMVTDCIQCGCTECCQCLGNCCTECGNCCKECGNCFADCGDCGCDCDCDCSD